jgi:HAD superfamily hydrolase (TIGR01509 family)
MASQKTVADHCGVPLEAGVVTLARLQPAAVVFDFDGTLVDTMPLHYAAYRKVFAEVNLALTEEMFYSNVGGKASDTIPRLLSGRPCPISERELHHRKKACINEIFRQAEIHVLPCSRLLPVLLGRVKLGIVSSGSRPGIEILLRRMGWLAWFDAIITGEDSLRSKPEPEPFLLAALQLCVSPANTLVFEDSAAGIQAARAAGMAAFDVSGNPAL